MPAVRILSRLGRCAGLVLLLAGCAQPTLVDDQLSAGGQPTTEFSVRDDSVTLTVRFDEQLGAGEILIVEWRFPDGRVYLRKPVRADGARIVETSMPVHDKAPSRHPGIWQVRMSRGAEMLVERSFAILAASEDADAGFAGLAHCGPFRWDDPVISGRRTGAPVSGVPGAWIGSELLDAAGATYSTTVLLTGCAPG